MGNNLLVVFFALHSWDNVGMFLDINERRLQMSTDDIIQNVKDAKFQIEFMALMLLSDRTDEAATAYEKALAKLSEIVGNEQ
tara:strand:+ start:482 stop:727 length:246 start_codon:yes stop_codon:yes gene_type:complete